MTFGALLRLTRANLRRERKSAGLSIFGVAVGVGALVFFVALGLGVGKLVRTRIFPVDASLLEVVPPPVSVGGLLGSARLDQAAVDRLSKLPGVKAVYRKMAVRVPATSRYDGAFFGANMHIGVEVLAVGVDPKLVEPDVVGGRFADPGPGQPIPAVASKRLLAIYDQSFAPARHLPRLTPEMLAGFTFPLLLGHSYVTRASERRTLETRLRVVGFSDRAPLAGVAIPLAAAERLNRAFGKDAGTFSAVTLRAADPSRIGALEAAVRSRGFSIDDSGRKLAHRAAVAVTLVTSALALLSVLICVLAAVSIAHAQLASVRARVKEVGIWRAVGARKRDVAGLIFAEAVVVGLCGGAIGTLAAWGASAVVEHLASSVLSSLPFGPVGVFDFRPWLVVLGIGLGGLAAVAGAIWPARRAAAVDPARVLAG